PAVWALAIADRVADGPTLAVHALPRLQVVWRPSDALSVTANAGRTVRPPDPDELYGDRGAFVGNPDLRPEDAWQADLGLHVARGPVAADVGVYWREVVDLIAFVVNAQQIARPANLERASIHGLDLGLSASASGLTLTTAATLLETVNRSQDPTYAGNALPRLPTFELEVGATASRGPAQLGYRGSYTAGNWLDAANYALSPQRVFHTAFGRLAIGDGWKLTGEVRNLANHIAAASPRDPLVDDGVVAVRAITDFTGYPLPGRAILLGVQWSVP
ncbi:MAG: TonB-dependent receptor, partial [Deltaproteobacteria bacterium]|nr:TonB-dependent receptor [Deltaproteobacteria bacterium]